MFSTTLIEAGPYLGGQGWAIALPGGTWGVVNFHELFLT